MPLAFVPSYIVTMDLTLTIIIPYSFCHQGVLNTILCWHLDSDCILCDAYDTLTFRFDSVYTLLCVCVCP